MYNPAGYFKAEGQTSRVGPCIINVSGGLKAKGHPVGATGAAQVLEVRIQVVADFKEEREGEDKRVTLVFKPGQSTFRRSYSGFKTSSRNGRKAIDTAA
ncbi:MAG: hypothetical protein ACE5JL_09755 [Dehalococcoidia bacterium]